MKIDYIATSPLLDNPVSSSSKSTEAVTDNSFSDLLNEALGAVDETSAADKLGNLQLLSGDTNALHSTLIDAEKAKLTLDLTVQIRDKVVEAYQEIMRMQV